MGTDTAEQTWFQRRAAVRVLAAQAKKGDRKAIDNLLRALEDASADVREAAAHGLAGIAEVGDVEVLTMLNKALQDESTDVRSSVLEALGVLAAGDANIITQIAHYATNMEKEQKVRVAALTALRMVGSVYWDSRHELLAPAVQTVADCTLEEDITVAITALGTLSTVAAASRDCAEQAVKASLKSSTPHIRMAALAALATMAPPSDADAITALSGCLTDDDSAVRAAALTALSRVATASDEDVITIICRCTDDKSPVVPVAAYAALRRIAPPGHERACFVAGARGLKHSEKDVRNAAAGMLADVAVRGDCRLMSVVGALLGDINKDVRLAAIASLEVLSEGGNADKGLHEFCKHLHHKAKAVRKEMREVIERLNGRGNREVINACCEGLKNRTRPDIRLDAIWSLQTLCNEADSFASERLAQLFDMEPVDENRRVLILVLATVGKSCPAAILTTAKAFVDAEDIVRDQALETIACVAPGGRRQAVRTLSEMLPLRDMLFEDRPSARLYIMQALEKIGPGCDESCAVDALVERTKDTYPAVRMAALRALEAVAARGNEPAVRAVAALLAVDDAPTRNQAMSRLKHIARPWDRTAALEASRVASTSKWYECRVAALHALAGVIDPGAEGFEQDEQYVPDEVVIERLELLAKQDEYEPVKKAAAEILRHIRDREPMPALGLGSKVYAPLGRSDPMALPD